MRVLVATDGSACSQRAVAECRRLFAGRPETEIKVVAVYEILYPVAGETFAVSSAFYQEYETDMKKQAELTADEAVMMFGGANGNGVSSEVLKGSAARAIVEAAKEWNADVIVVGSHGRGFWGRLTLGSVSDAIIHHAPCSVLVVRDKKPLNGNG